MKKSPLLAVNVMGNRGGFLNRKLTYLGKLIFLQPVQTKGSSYVQSYHGIHEREKKKTF